MITDAWKPQIDGVVTTLERVVEHLEAAGDDLLIIDPSRFRTVPLPRYAHIRLSIAPRRRVSRLLDDFAPDAIHLSTEGPLGFAARRYCARRGLRFTTSFHTQFAQYGKSYFRIPSSWTYRLLRWFRGKADRTLVPTAGVLRELEANGLRNLEVWTRGVDTELFRPAAEKNLYHRARPIFLYCGHVAREKNIEAFLDADLPGTKVVVGDGPAMSSLRNLHTDVVFTGFKRGRELADHVAAGDVFVFPSNTDTFGVVMLEAAGWCQPSVLPCMGFFDHARKRSG